MFTQTKRLSALPLTAILLTGCAVLFSGCGDDAGTTDKVAVKPKPKDKDKATDGGKTDGTPKAKPANQVAFPKDKAVGQVAGIALFEGKAPKRGEIDISSKEECTKLHAGAKTVPDESLIVDDNGGVLTVRNVFVYVNGGLEQYTFDAPTEPVVLDQKGCIYTPHVFGLRLGQTLTVKNSDPLTHNVHYPAAKHAMFNKSQGAGAKDDVNTFNKEDEVFAAFKCDVHTWMKAYMGVVDHPAFAVTDDKGAFGFPIKLPAGKYKLTARHESGRTKSVDIEVAADGKVTPEKIEFKFTRKELTGGN